MILTIFAMDFQHETLGSIAISPRRSVFFHDLPTGWSQVEGTQESSPKKQRGGN